MSWRMISKVAIPKGSIGFFIPAFKLKGDYIALVFADFLRKVSAKDSL